MRLTSLIEDMERFAKEKNVPIMQKEGINYLKEYVNTNKINDILEIGTAIGYSTIILRSCSRSITSIERDEERYNIALKNVSLSKLDNITLINIDALEANITGEYDMIFIDASKGKNLDFINKYKNNLREKGVIFIDNMGFHGLVGNSSSIKSRNLRSLVRKIEKFIQYLDNQSEFKVTKIDVGDGLYLLERNNNE